jgi:hypothetical protein
MNVLFGAAGAFLIIIGLLRQFVPATLHIGYHVILLPSYFIVGLGILIIIAGFYVHFPRKLETDN